MRRMSSLILVILFLMQSTALNLIQPAQAAGQNDDYRVTSITLGATNTSSWVQSDGTVQKYVFVGDEIDITISVQRNGSGFTGEIAPVMLEIVHPIGFVMETFTWETAPIVGGQGDAHSLKWTPSAAHSILNTTTNDLSGGLILCATVQFPDDDRNANDALDSIVPVAIMRDKFDGTAGGIDPTFFSGKYPADGGDAFAIGSWQTDTTSSAIGSKHWRHSAPGSNYPSGAEATRLVYSNRLGGQTCDQDSMLDPGLTNSHQVYICRRLFFSSNFISTQYHMQAWGSMAAGDSVSMELWRGSGNINDDMESISWDITNGNPSQAAGQWTNLSWDPQVTWQQIPGLAYPEIFLGGNSYTFSVLFTSDSSSASEGFHVDDLVQFGVSKVTDYTLDLSCDNPTGGYTVAPNQLAVLHCSLTNNGYAPATIRLQSNVTNDSWMAPYPVIRIDVEDSNNHNINQVMSPLGGGKTIEFWANLSVPAGADVQQQTWNLWLTDASSAALGEKARIDMDLAVSEQFSVSLTSSVGLVAGTIAPSEYGLVEFKLLNAGNRDAAFNLNTNFASENPGWSAVVQNETGVIIPNPIVLGRGTYEDLVLNITAPDDAAPGTVPFNLMATCPSCSTTLFGTDRLSRNIEVPVLRTVFLETEDYELEAAANGVQKVAYISIFNLGNDDEQYDLSIEQSNWRLEASLAATQSPVLDAWDGEATFVLNLPMPIGLSPGLYNVRVIAANVDDPLVRTHIDIGIDILDTSAVAVSNEVPGQSYIPGDLPQTMKFEVFNNGNRADRFAMSFGLPEGMQASYTNLMTGDITPEIAVGASYNVTVQFSFLDGASGDLTLQVIATSTADSSVSSSGTATYLVGSQNWLKIYAVQPLEISEEGEYEIEIRIRNQYTSAQYVAMELDDSNTKSWFQTKIESQLDRNFALQKDEERTITVTVDVSATTLKSLSNDSLVTTLTVWARSETVSDAAQQTIQLTLLKTDTSSSTTTQDDSSSSLDVATIGMWVIFLLIIGIGAVVLFNIVTTVEEEDEYKDWDQDYEDSLVASYGAVAAAPTVPMVSTPSLASAAAPPAQSAAPVATPVAAPVAQGPPVPAAGLPAGWTMEQWEVYGQQWLDSQS